jgi:DNA primase
MSTSASRQPSRQRAAESSPPFTDTLRGRLVTAHEHAAAYYADLLRSPTGDGPRGYLEQRRVGALIDSSAWTIGYAPAGWTGLTQHLRSAGFADEELVLAGLGLVTRRGSVVDRFRDRVTFGIRNQAGDLIGFTARSAPGERSDVPKYLNSPRTALYDKGMVLFGLADQHHALVRGATPVLVEGPIDVLAVAASNHDGVTALAAVAPCGTALTKAQSLALTTASTSEVLVVAFDSDPAGDRAAATAYELLSPHVPHLQVADLPRGSDPAELLALHGPERLRDVLSDTAPLADRVVDRILRRYRDRDHNAEARVAALHEVAPVLAALSPAEVGREVARVARALRFEHPLVTEQVTTALTEQRPRARTSTGGRYDGQSTTRPASRASMPSMRLH